MSEQTTNDKAAEDIYYNALNALFYIGNKAEFAKACRKAAETADDQNMKTHYTNLALQYEQ